MKVCATVFSAPDVADPPGMVHPLGISTHCSVLGNNASTQMMGQVSTPRFPCLKYDPNKVKPITWCLQSSLAILPLDFGICLHVLPDLRIYLFTDWFVCQSICHLFIYIIYIHFTCILGFKLQLSTNGWLVDKVVGGAHPRKHFVNWITIGRILEVLGYKLNQQAIPLRDAATTLWMKKMTSQSLVPHMF